MEPANSDEYLVLVETALMLIIVLISCFMCIQLYHLRRPGAPPCPLPALAL